EWMLGDTTGAQFGVGRDGMTPVYVEFSVGTDGQPTADASINGWVWEDYCRLLNAEGGEPMPSGGCIEDGLGGYRADGTPNNGERGIAGVHVTLSAGECGDGYSNGISAVTDEQGEFTFGGLQAGSYCVSLNALQEENVPILLPGITTHPYAEFAVVTVRLEDGEQKSGVDFGWDYQLQ
ncbi:MAG: hypothetical protein M3220_09495, partial [Chloroflexota bacterium]|nr:hypothetical protein [Chloroflexota bacterium]